VNKRKLELGNRNIVGARVTEARNNMGLKQKDLLARLQVEGVPISIPALSLLEGQKRPVSDIELKALSEILDVDVFTMLVTNLKHRLVGRRGLETLPDVQTA